ERTCRGAAGARGGRGARARCRECRHLRRTYDVLGRHCVGVRARARRDGRGGDPAVARSLTWAPSVGKVKKLVLRGIGPRYSVLWSCHASSSPPPPPLSSASR